MKCGTITADPKPSGPGILTITVLIGRDEVHHVQVADSPAARCVEEEDSLCLVDGQVLWSNRSRTVRDVELVKAAAKN